MRTAGAKRLYFAKKMRYNAFDRTDKGAKCQMKIITIVGIRKSGKTTTVTELVSAMRRRGLRVGTCKTVFCPTFSIDKPTSNTARHRRAGAELVCARAKGETTFLYPEQLPLSVVAQRYTDCDYLLLEGDYYAPVPRVVTAHFAQDALERQNDLTIAFAGRVGAKPEEALPLPRFNVLEDADALIDYLNEHVPDVEDLSVLDNSLPVQKGVSDDGFCQCGCHVHTKKQAAEGVEVVVNGKAVKLSDEQRAMVMRWAQENCHE